jgi:hypothetical protein
MDLFAEPTRAKPPAFGLRRGSLRSLRIKAKHRLAEP